VCSITQYGSTRSINAGVAAGIAMHTWIRQHAVADLAVAPPGGPDGGSDGGPVPGGPGQTMPATS
jgi:hypothetical protein